MKRKMFKRLLVLSVSASMVFGTCGTSLAATVTETSASAEEADAGTDTNTAEDSAGITDAQTEAVSTDEETLSAAEAAEGGQTAVSEEAAAAESTDLEQDSDGYYLISSGDDMDAFAELVQDDTSVNARLTQDITLNEDYIPIGVESFMTGNSSTPSYPYAGTFDGQGYTISGLSISGSYYYVGLFAAITSGALVEDFTLEGSVTGKGYVAGVVAYATGGTIRNVTTNVDVTSTSSTYTAGILGYVKTSAITVQACVNNGTITGGGNYAAGIAAYLNVSGCYIVGCKNTGEIVNGGSYTGFGGVVGSAYTASSYIYGCINTGRVHGGSSYTGGVVGYLKGTVKYCINTGEVSTSSTTSASAGGVVGYFYSSTVDSCFNTGSFTSGYGYYGGVVGQYYSSTSSYSLTNCYNRADVGSSSVARAGGVAYYIPLTGTLTHCYNTGTITASSYAGALFAYTSTTGSITKTTYCYALEGTADYLNGGNRGSFSSDTNAFLSEEDLKGAGSSSSDYYLGSAYKEDSTNVNDGYPILAYQGYTASEVTKLLDAIDLDTSSATDIGYAYAAYYCLSDEDQESVSGGSAEDTLTVTKEVSDTDTNGYALSDDLTQEIESAAYTFTLYRSDDADTADGVAQAGIAYTLTAADGTQTSAVTDENGSFTLKDGESAVFTGASSSEDTESEGSLLDLNTAGYFYVQEEAEDAALSVTWETAASAGETIDSGTDGTSALAGVAGGSDTAETLTFACTNTYVQDVISVAKVVDDKNLSATLAEKLNAQSYTFTLYQDEEALTGASYAIYEDGKATGETGTTDADDGTFTLTGGQTAYFTGLTLNNDVAYRVEESGLTSSCWSTAYETVSSDDSADISDGMAFLVSCSDNSADTIAFTCTNTYTPDTIAVTKEVPTDGLTTAVQAYVEELDFTFTLYDAADDTPVTGESYTVYDADGAVVEDASGTTDAGTGAFTLKAGQTAKFEEIDLNGSVSYYVEEEALDTSWQVAWTTETSDAEGEVSASDTDRISGTASMTGSAAASDTITFTCTNTYTPDTISVQKLVSETNVYGVALNSSMLGYVNGRSYSFTLYRTDGEEASPVEGESYTVYDTDGEIVSDASGTTGTDGTFSITAGQTAKFENISLNTDTETSYSYYVTENDLDPDDWSAEWEVSSVMSDGEGEVTDGSDDDPFTSGSAAAAGDETVSDTISFVCTNTYAHTSFLIYTLEDLVEFSKTVTAGYCPDATVMADIDATVTTTDGDILEPVGGSLGLDSSYATTYPVAYTGTFDGNDKTITLAMDNSGYYFTGLFGSLGTGGVIKDLTLNGSVTGGYYTGGLVAISFGGTIENVTSNLAVTSSAQRAGGIVCYHMSEQLTITDCVNNGTITSGGIGAAGIITYVLTTGTYTAPSVTITGCENHGAVNGSSTNAAGIIGYLSSSSSNVSSMTDCVNDAAISGTGSSGGIAGYWYAASSSISDCTNTGSVTGTSTYCGGITGYFYGSGAAMTSCTNTGDVSGTYYIGGMAGYCYGSGAAITSCINTGALNGTYYIGGIVGYLWVASVEYCGNSGTVTTTGGSTLYGGGVAGYVAGSSSYGYGTLNSCYNKGDLTGTTRLGGVVGYMTSSSSSLYSAVTNCYNTGDISTSAAYAGGIAANVNNDYSAMQNCYSTGSVSSSSSSTQYVGILVGYFSSSTMTNISNNYGLSTAADDVSGNYSSTTYTSGKLTAVDSDELKTYATAGTDDDGNETDSVLGSAYKEDTIPINDGYPILIWEDSDDGDEDSVVAAGDIKLVLDYGLPVDFDAQIEAADGVTYTMTSLLVSADEESAYADSATGTYGTLAVTEETDDDDNTVYSMTYTPTAQLNGIDTLYYQTTVSVTDSDSETTDYTLTGTVTIVPATSVYYEEDFGTEGLSTVTSDTTLGMINYSHGSRVWTTDTTGTAGTTYKQGTTSTSLADTYGSDAAYESDAKDSAGHAIGVTEDTSRLYCDTYGAYLNYDFTGTGTTVYGRFAYDNALVKVQLYTYDENGDKTLTETKFLDSRNLAEAYGVDALNGTLYNTPLFDTAYFDETCDEDGQLAYGHYMLRIYVYQAGMTVNGVKDSSGEYIDGTTSSGVDFYLDGVRVYNPLGTSTSDSTDYETASACYTSDGESSATTVNLRDNVAENGTTGNFATLTTTSGDVTDTSTYSKYGPKRELYLYSSGSSDVDTVSFYILNWDSSESSSNKIYLAMKSPKDGDIATATVGTGSNTKSYTISHAMDLYYDITDYISTATVTLNVDSDNDGTADKTETTTVGLVTISADSGLLSLTNIKLIGAELADNSTITTSTTEDGESVTVSGVSSAMVYFLPTTTELIAEDVFADEDSTASGDSDAADSTDVSGDETADSSTDDAAAEDDTDVTADDTADSSTDDAAAEDDTDVTGDATADGSTDDAAAEDDTDVTDDATADSSNDDAAAEDDTDVTGDATADDSTDDAAAEDDTNETGDATADDSTDDAAAEDDTDATGDAAADGSTDDTAVTDGESAADANADITQSSDTATAADSSAGTADTDEMADTDETLSVNKIRAVNKNGKTRLTITVSSNVSAVRINGKKAKYKKTNANGTRVYKITLQGDKRGRSVNVTLKSADTGKKEKSRIFIPVKLKTTVTYAADAQTATIVIKTSKDVKKVTVGETQAARKKTKAGYRYTVTVSSANGNDVYTITGYNKKGTAAAAVSAAAK